MGRRTTLMRAAALLLAGASAMRLGAQDAESRLAPGDAELPVAVRRALAEIADFSLDFDHPGFDALLAHVRETPEPPGSASVEPADWRELLERPRAFRGRRVRIEGVVGRNKAWARAGGDEADRRPVWQLELARADQPIACTVILTQPADDVPIGATVDLSGYFVMIRKYLTASQREALAALVVARAPTAISLPAAASPAGPLDWRWMLAAAALGLLAAWVLLRRGWADRRSGVDRLRAARRERAHDAPRPADESTFPDDPTRPAPS